MGRCGDVGGRGRSPIVTFSSVSRSFTWLYRTPYSRQACQCVVNDTLGDVEGLCNGVVDVDICWVGGGDILAHSSSPLTLCPTYIVVAYCGYM